MKHLRTAFAAALILLPAIAGAQQAQFPTTLPKNTVVGRTGIGPGPAQAISFDVLRTFIGSAVTIGGASGPVFTLDPTLKMSGSQLGVVVGTFGATIPLNNGNNIFSGANTFRNSTTFTGSVTLPAQPSYSLLLNNSGASAPPGPVTVGALTLNTAPSATGTTVPCETGGVLGRCAAGAVAASGPPAFATQAAYSWLLNNTNGSAAPTPVTIGALTTNGSPDPSNTTVPCETGGVLRRCTAGSLAGSLSSGVATIDGTNGPNFTLDTNTLQRSGTTLAVKTGTTGHTLGFLDGINTYTGANTFSGANLFSGPATLNAATLFGQTQFGLNSVPNSYGRARFGTCNNDCSGNRLWDIEVGYGDYSNYNFNIYDVGANATRLSIDLSGRLQLPAYSTAGCLANDSTGKIVTTTCPAVFTTTTPGYVPASGGGTTNFLRADGFFAPPPTPPAASPNLLNVRSYGTIGAGNDNAAFQNAVNALAAGNSVYVPCGNYTFAATVTFGDAGFRIAGDDVSCVRITVNGNFPAFTVSSTANLQGNVFRDITCINTVDGAGTSCLLMTGTSGGVGYSLFSRIRCFGANACLRNSRNVNVGGEAGFDWNKFSDIQTSNNGSVPTRYAIYFDNGSGTGNVYSNMNLVVSNGGIVMNGGNGSNIGDITFDAIQFGGAGTALFLQNGATYHSRVTVTNIQCDAGINQCVNAQNYDHVSLIGVALGGGIGNALGTPTSFYCGSFAC